VEGSTGRVESRISCKPPAHELSLEERESGHVATGSLMESLCIRTLALSITSVSLRVKRVEIRCELKVVLLRCSLLISNLRAVRNENIIRRC
jgi:hypothetical protein